MACLSYGSIQLSRIPIIAAFLLAGTLTLLGVASSPARAASEVWEKSELMQPEELAAALNDPNHEKTAIIFVGFDFFSAPHTFPERSPWARVQKPVAWKACAAGRAA